MNEPAEGAFEVACQIVRRLTSTTMHYRVPTMKFTQ